MKKQLFSFLFYYHSSSAFRRKRLIRPRRICGNTSNIWLRINWKDGGRVSRARLSRRVMWRICLRNYKLKAGVSQTVGTARRARIFCSRFRILRALKWRKRAMISSSILIISRVKAENISVKPVGFSPNGEVADAKIIFAGYGIESGELKYNDYEEHTGTASGDLDAKGKIVLVFDGTPDNSPNSPFTRFDAARQSEYRQGERRGRIAFDFAPGKFCRRKTHAVKIRPDARRSGFADVYHRPRTPRGKYSELTKRT